MEEQHIALSVNALRAEHVQRQRRNLAVASMLRLGTLWAAVPLAIYNIVQLARGAPDNPHDQRLVMARFSGSILCGLVVGPDPGAAVPRRMWIYTAAAFVFLIAAFWSMFR